MRTALRLAIGIAALSIGTVATGSFRKDYDTYTRAEDDPASVREARSDLFCTKIIEIMKEGRGGFEDYKGAFRTDRNYWVSTVMMPGADECRITYRDDGHKEYFCGWPASGAEDANAQALRMATHLRWCAWYALDYQTGAVPSERGRPGFEHRMFTQEGDTEYGYHFWTRGGNEARVEMQISVLNRPHVDGEISDEPVGPAKW